MGYQSPVFDHVVIRCSDRDASEAFYARMLGALGIEQTASEAFAQWHDFSITAAGPERGVTTGLHVGFVAPSREAVDRWWTIGRETGYVDAGAPGPREQYRHDYYGAFLRDPDGNSIEAVHHGALREGGNVDHVWLRVDDLGRARTFADLFARHAGVRTREARVEPGVHVVTPEEAPGAGSFTYVAGEPTRNAHLALPAPRADVDAFHAEAMRLGFQDDGAPGPRPHFAPGYYAAFVLDPGGSSFELVDRAGA